MQLCISLNIEHCPSLGLEWKLIFSTPVATAEFSKFFCLCICNHISRRIHICSNWDIIWTPVEKVCNAGSDWQKISIFCEKDKGNKKNGVGDIYRHSIINLLGFPSDPAGKVPTCQCRRCKRLRFDLWVGKIPLEKEMATCSSVLAFLAWKILETEPGWLQSMGLQSWTWLSVPAYTLWVFYLFWLHPQHWVTEQPRRVSIRL